MDILFYRKKKEGIFRQKNEKYWLMRWYNSYTVFGGLLYNYSLNTVGKSLRTVS